MRAHRATDQKVSGLGQEGLGHVASLDPPRYIWRIVLGTDLLLLFFAITLGEYPTQFFGERRPVTLLSFIQLAAAAVVLLLVFRIRSSAFPGRGVSSPALIWLLMAAGFVFMAFDEVLLFHEHLDEWIHQWFGMEETAITDRIDDVIVLAYGLIGIALLAIYRKEIRVCRRELPWFVGGFIAMFAMVVLDAGTNRKDVLEWFVMDEALLETLHVWLSIVEEFCKIIAEGLFIIAFLHCLHFVRFEKALR